MTSFYKYTKFFGIEKLKDLHLRLSTPSVLNDPFENIFNKTLEAELEKNIKVKDMLHNIYDIINDGNDGLANIIQERILSLGIVSLSETPRNLLMWAHYADEHKGICIEFDGDMMFNQELNHLNRRYAIQPTKVYYDKIRPSYECHTHDELNKHIKKHLLTKSDEWIYEKEHRCIMPLECCDKVILDESTLDESQRVALEEMINAGKINKNDKEYDARFDSIYQIAYLAGREYHKKITFLKKVDVNSIKSIYIGCRCEDKNIILKEVLSPNSPLKHVKLFECTPSTTRFELEMNPMN